MNYFILLLYTTALCGNLGFILGTLKMKQKFYFVGYNFGFVSTMVWNIHCNLYRNTVLKIHSDILLIFKTVFSTSETFLENKFMQLTTLYILILLHYLFCIYLTYMFFKLWKKIVL